MGDGVHDVLSLQCLKYDLISCEGWYTAQDF